MDPGDEARGGCQPGDARHDAGDVPPDGEPGAEVARGQGLGEARLRPRRDRRPEGAAPVAECVEMTMDLPTNRKKSWASHNENDASFGSGILSCRAGRWLLQQQQPCSL